MPQTALLRGQCGRRSSMRAKRGMPQATKSAVSWRSNQPMCLRGNGSPKLRRLFLILRRTWRHCVTMGAPFADLASKSDAGVFWHASCVHLR